MNILNQKNKELYALPKISLTSIKDYELLDYVMEFKSSSFYFNLNEGDLDLIFIDRDEAFGFRGINNFDDIKKLIKIEKDYLYIFKDFKVINKFSISDEVAPTEEWYFDIILWLKCLKTGREKYVFFELR